MPQTLLLADDSVTIQRVIELTFADEDINVFAVSDGDQAIEKIDADPPDIVLVDVGMPGRSGFDVARHIKGSPRLQHIPVLLLTGAFEPVDEATAASAGCDGVLAKPFEPQLVISRVKDLLGRSGGSDLTDSAPVPSDVAVADPAPAAQTPDVWGERPSAPPPADDVARPAQIARLDSYFAKLDEAFSSLGSSNPPAAETPRVAASGPSPVADMIDWFGAAPGAAPTAPPDLPLVEEPAAEVIDIPDPEASLAEWTVDADSPADTEPPSPEPVPEYQEPVASYLEAEPDPDYLEPELQHSEPAAQYTAPPSLPSLPALADAFDAILAAEQHEPMPLAAPAWPGTTATAAHARNGDGTLSEEAIEMITRRVLERLSDRIVRETVADLVSAVAERLVREEIERIKASIQ
jgi:CheY-like chemotaxis protein